MSQFTIPTFSAEMNKQLFKPFGEELIKRIAKFAASRDPDEDTTDNAIEWSMDILEQMFNRDDTVKIVKKNISIATDSKKSVAVQDTDDESEMIQAEQVVTIDKAKRGRPKKVKKDVSTMDLLSSMCDDAKPIKKVSKAKQKKMERFEKLSKEANELREKLGLDKEDFNSDNIDDDISELKLTIKDLKKDIRLKATAAKKAAKELEKEKTLKEKAAKKAAKKTETPKKTPTKDFTVKRLTDANKKGIKGRNDKWLRIKVHKETGKVEKVNENNYTDEANARFEIVKSESENTKPVAKKKVEKKVEALKYFRAYNIKDSQSKAKKWKPYHEDEKKRAKADAKYSTTLIALDQWKLAAKAGDKADIITTNPYEKSVKESPTDESSNDEEVADKDVAGATSELEEEEFDEEDINVDFSNIQNINIATDQIEVSDSDDDDDLTEF